MPDLPSVKQRTWHALRISRYLTLNDLCITVDASKGTIAKHLREWIWVGAAKATLKPRTGKGRPPLIYSLTNPQTIDPP